jgi:hypothetical protein
MPNEFIARNGLIAQNNSIITGSLTVTGTITATTLVAQTVTSSTSWITGSTKFGSITSNTHQFTGSILQSGSLATFAGSVGIGTTSPNRLTEIAASNGAVLGIANSNESGGSGILYGRIAMYSIAGSNTYIDYGGEIRSYSGPGVDYSDLRFYTAFGATSTERMRITSGGNVGIGSTSPGYKLDVSGNGRFTYTSGVPALDIRASDTNFALMSILGNQTGDVNWLLMSGYPNAGDFTIRQSDVVNAITIKKTSGNVGIGTTSPSANKLNVFGTQGDGSTTVQQDLLHIGGNELGGVGGYAGIRLAGTTGTSYGVYIRGVKTTSYGNFWNDALTFSVTRTNTETTVDEVMRITADGNVGIGTTSPNEKFHVAGNIHAYAAGGIDAGLYASTTAGSTTISIRSSGASIFNGGNVGIGTTSPSYKLHISGNLYVNNGVSNGSGVSLFVQGSGDVQLTDGGSIFWGAYSYSNGTYIRGYDDSDIMYFYSNGTNMAYFKSNLAYFAANVGIGTTSPIGKLQIGGTSGNLLTVGTLTNDWGGDVAIGATNGNGVIISKINTNNDQNRVLVLSRDDSGGGGTVIGYKPSGLSNAIGFRLQSTGSSYFDGGNVGIGTTSPSFLLNIYGSNAATVYQTSGTGTGSANGFYVGHTGNISYVWNYNNFPLVLAVNNAEVMRITGSNVGIGTTSPKTRLDVAGAGGKISITNTGTSDYGELQYYEGSTLKADIWVNGSSQTNYAGGNSFNIYQASNAPMAFYTNGANERMRIEGGGNIGIGTTSPTDVLDVKNFVVFGSSTERLSMGSNSLGFNRKVATGAIYDSGAHAYQFQHTQNTTAASDYLALQVYNTGGNSVTSYALAVNGAGSVGIGTSSPGYKLHVVGSIYASSQISSTGAMTIGMTPAPFWNAKFTDYSDGSGVYIGSVQAGGYKYISGESYYNNSSYWYSDTTTSTAIGLGSGILRFYTNSGLTANTDFTPSERMRIDTGGNVGIGTSSPSYLLDVAGTSRSDLHIFRSNQSAPTADAFIFRPADNTVALGTANTERLRITSGGNVGIGTTSPSYRLHIVTNAVAGRQDMSNISRTTGNWVRFTNPQYSTDASMGLILRVFPDSDARQGAGIIASGGSNNACTNLDLFVTTSPDGLGGTSYSAIRVDGFSGNVGIGTTSPTRLLEIYGPALTSDTPTLRISSADSSGTRKFGIEFYSRTGADVRGKLLVDNNGRVYLDDNGGGGVVLQANGGTGNVGIGTTSPSFTLDVAGNIGINGRLFAFNSATYTVITDPAGGIKLYLGASGDPGNYYDNTSHNFRSAGGGTTYAVINTNGNLGIGRTSPSYKLDVSGSTRIFGYLLGVDNSTTIKYVFTNDGGASYINSGNVGIGTTSPASKLQVAGSTNVVNIAGSGSATSSSIFSVDGNNGRLFEITDDLSDSIFSANTIAGLPVIEAFSDYSVRLGTYSATSGSTINITGSNVGIGTTNPLTRIEVYNSSEDRHFSAIGASPSLNLYSSNTSPVYGGTVGLATGTDAYLQGSAVGDLCILTRGSYSSGIILFGSGSTKNASISTAGTITARGDMIAYGTPSDISFKTNIVPIQGSLDIIQKLEPVSFTWKEDTESNKLTNIKDDLGFIAQQVQEVLPELVRENDNGTLSLRERGIIPLLVGAIKELKAEIDILKNK